MTGSPSVFLHPCPSTSSGKGEKCRISLLRGICCRAPSGSLRTCDRSVVVSCLGLSAKSASCKLRNSRRGIGSRIEAVINHELAFHVPPETKFPAGCMSPVA